MKTNSVSIKEIVPKFITIEGGEGTGKTSIINMLIKDLINDSVNVIQTREPGGSKIAEEIRNIILNVENVNMDYMTEALLYCASRRQHLEEIVKPALKEGKHVICDRYIDSSLAYQGYARGIGIEKIYDINKYATDGFLPDLTILIDLPPLVGLERIQKNSREVDRLDLEKQSFHDSVRKGYLKVSEMFKDRIVVVDGNRPLHEVYEDCKKIIYRELDI